MSMLNEFVPSMILTELNEAKANFRLTHPYPALFVRPMVSWPIAVFSVRLLFAAD